MGALCKQKNILLCVDAIQSLGIIPMDVKKYHIDFLSADAHKWLLGPEGIGIFYCRSEHIEKMRPPLVGWKCVQNELDFDHPHFLFKTNALKFEEGSMNLIGIIGLGAALDLLFEIGIENIEERVLDLGDLIVQEAKKRDYVVVTPNSRKERGGSITFTGQFHLLQIWEGLRNRKAMINVRGGGLRISPHFYNTEREIMAVFNLIDQVIISD